MSKTPDITTLTRIDTAVEPINDNFEKVSKAFENTLSLDGSTPNAMEADIDLNGYSILNVKDLTTADGTSLNDAIEEAEGYASDAASSASEAADSATSAEESKEYIEEHYEEILNVYDDYDDMASNIVSRGDGTVVTTRKEGFSYVEDSTATNYLEWNDVKAVPQYTVDGFIPVPLKSGATFSATDAAENASTLLKYIKIAGSGGKLKVVKSDGIISMYPVGIVSEMVTLDWGFNSVVWDLSHGDDAAYVSDLTDFENSDIQPGVAFIGETADYALSSSISEGDIEITVTASAAAALSAGDVISLTSDDTGSFWNAADYTGTYDYTETNRVEDISGTTVTLSVPARWDYVTNPILRKYETDYSPVVQNGFHSEVDYSDRYGGSVSEDWTPNIFRASYTKSARFERLEFANTNVSTISIKGGIDAVAINCKLSLPQRPSEGGHGNLVKAQDFASENLTVRKCSTVFARHLIDWTYANNGQSVQCRGLEDVATYTWHGFGTKKCRSIDDYSDSATGWGVGRNQFGADFDIEILRPSGVARRRGIEINGASDGVYLTGGNLVAQGTSNTARIVVVSEAAKNVRVRGNTFRVGDAQVASNIVTVDKYLTGSEGDAGNNFSDVPENIDISGNTYILKDGKNAARVAYCDGFLAADDNTYIVLDGNTSKGLTIESSVEATLSAQSLGGKEVIVDGGTLTGFDNNSSLSIPYSLRFSDGSTTEVSSETMTLNSDETTPRLIQWKTDGSDRWLFGVGNDPEGGSNSGADLVLRSREDDGSALLTLMTLERTGKITATAGAFQVSGSWDKPFRLGNLRMWSNGSVVYVKNNSDPTSASDGTVLGTQS